MSTRLGQEVACQRGWLRTGLATNASPSPEGPQGDRRVRLMGNPFGSLEHQ